MNKFENNKWYSFEKDGPPPFDTAVVVFGEREVTDQTGKSHGFIPCYCMAFNECYRPDVSMTQILELSKVDQGVLGKSYTEVPFPVSKWMILNVE